MSCCQGEGVNRPDTSQASFENRSPSCQVPGDGPQGGVIAFQWLNITGLHLLKALYSVLCSFRIQPQMSINLREPILEVHADFPQQPHLRPKRNPFLDPPIQIPSSFPSPGTLPPPQRCQ